MSDLTEESRRVINFQEDTDGGYILVYSNGAYIACFRVKYMLECGGNVEKNSGNFLPSSCRKIQIPSGASNIIVNVEELAEPPCRWITIFTQCFDSPVKKSYTIWGTTLNPKWKENELI